MFIFRFKIFHDCYFLIDDSCLVKLSSYTLVTAEVPLVKNQWFKLQ